MQMIHYCDCCVGKWYIQATKRKIVVFLTALHAGPPLIAHCVINSKIQSRKKIEIIFIHFSF